MKRIRDYLDMRYVKICAYAAVTVLATVAALMILYFSSGFWKTIWGMFTAVMTPLVTGGIICYLFTPLLNKIEKLISKKPGRWSRPAAIAICYLIIAAVLGALILALYFALKGSIDDIGKIDFETIKDFVMSLENEFSDIIKSLESEISASDLPFAEAGSFVSRFFSAVSTFFSSLLFGIIFSIYFMLDGDNIGRYWTHAFRVVAGSQADDALKSFAADADRVFSGYIRGQFIDAFLVGIISSLALLIAGVPYAVIIGIFVGIGNLIPYVGPIVGYGAVAVICLITGQFDKLIIGLIILAAIMFIDGNIINPKLLSDNVKVHPLLVVAALIGGGAIGGFVGMIVAVPVAALIKLQFDRYLERKDAQEN